MAQDGRKNLIAELATAAEENRADEFLRFMGKGYTFGDIHEAVERAARYFTSVGVKAGDRVGIRLKNGPEWVISWFATLRLEAVAVPINYAYEVADLNHVLSDSGAVLVVTDGASRSTIESTGAYKGGSVRIVTDIIAESRTAPDVTLPLPDDIRSDALANLQYTSGTTGFPKACMLTHAYWTKLAEIAAVNSRAARGDVALTAQPYSYIDPQWNTALCLITRIPLVIGPRFSASKFWTWVRNEGVTFFYVLGTMPTLLYKQEPTPHDRDNRVRLVLCSGIPPALHQDLEERWGAPWREAYGLTETGIDICVPLEDASSVGSGTIGWPVSSKEAKVVDGAGQIVAPGEQGALVLHGEPMMRGYWNRPEETTDALRDGWFHTGDLVVQSDDGSFRLVGRLKDMVRRGGENISAAEVENTANQHPAIVSSAVIGVPDELWGEQVKLFVQVKQSASADYELAADVFEHLRDRLARFKLPRYIAFVDSFPMTPSERIAKVRIPDRLDTEGPDVYALP